jgi:hypothetical protein
MRLQTWIMLATKDKMSPDCSRRNAPGAGGRITALAEMITKRCMITTQSSEQKSVEEGPEGGGDTSSLTGGAQTTTLPAHR